MPTRTLWPWIVATVVAVPVLYVASIPPAVWAINRDPRPVGTGRYWVYNAYLWPADLCYEASPAPVRGWMNWYGSVTTRPWRESP